MDTYMYGTMRS